MTKRKLEHANESSAALLKEKAAAEELFNSRIKQATTSTTEMEEKYKNILALKDKELDDLKKQLVENTNKQISVSAQFFYIS